MNYKLCKLYGLQSKKELYFKLGKNEKPSFFTKKNIIKNINPIVLKKDNGKSRLVEIPTDHLKCVQKILNKYLTFLDYPDYLYAGVKHKSYINNAKIHKPNYYVYSVDINKFFPNTSRNKVFNFFINEMNMSKDVATIVTNLTTIDLKQYKESENYNEITNFIRANKIKHSNHLITGASTSILLAYLVNYKMFEALSEIAIKNNLTYTVYVDDVIFSSLNPIGEDIRNSILKVINKNGYGISIKKIKYKRKGELKKITGIYINKKRQLKAPNKIHKKANEGFKNIVSTGNKTEINKIIGYMEVANQIDGSFSNQKKILYTLRKKK